MVDLQWGRPPSTAAERERTPTTRATPRTLIAVSYRSNRQKADKDLSKWLPTPAHRCQYAPGAGFS